MPIALPIKKVAVETPSKPLREPSVARANELIDAGMNAEAGEEIEQNEKEILKHLGGDKALPWLIDLYKRAGNYHRAYRLGESRGAGALGRRSAARRGDARDVGGGVPARVRSRWSTSTAPAAGNPELFLYAIMRKESGFDPHDVSYADARGLLQMIPPTSTQVAAAMGEPFFPDQLYDPEINIRLGASYIGELYGSSAREVQLTAGAYNGGPRTMARWCEQNAQAPHRRVRRADRLPADARIRQARDEHLREVPLPVRRGALRDSAGPDHQGRRRTDLLDRARVDAAKTKPARPSGRIRRPAPAPSAPPQRVHQHVGFDPARIRAASIYCSDGRFGEQMDEFLHQGLGLPRYDRLAVPGGPACLSGALSVFWESHSAERQLDFLCHVHKLERLVMIAHEGCAFYLEWLKVKPERARGAPAGRRQAGRHPRPAEPSQP